MMSVVVKAALLFLLGAQAVSSTALDDYVNTPDDNYKWVDMVSFTENFPCWIFLSSTLYRTYRVLSTPSAAL
jgi:hypothetical protein